MKFECPHCAQHLDAEKEHLGSQVECPSCGEPIDVPYGLEAEQPLPNIKAESSPTPPPHRKPSQTRVELGDEDQQKMWGLRGAMFVMPLYMLSLLFILIGFWQTTGSKLNPGIAKLAIPFLIILVGISIRSWQCIGWLKTDTYKAAAIGKNLFLIFLILAAFDTLLAEFPRAKFEGPMSAVDSRLTFATGNFVTDPDQTMIYEPNLFWWLGYLFTVAQQLIEHFSIYAFILLLYKSLRRGRPHFSWSHFLGEISFGKYGTEYNWSESGRSRD